MAKLTNTYALNQMEIERALIISVFYSYGAYVHGDIAEFGTNTGRTASAIATAMRDYESRMEAKGRTDAANKNIHLFDSFKGMPEAEHDADISSPDVINGTWGKGSLKTLSAEQLFSMVGSIIDHDKVVIYEGFYSETLEKISKDIRFSMLHMDSTLYQSTFEVLDYLFRERHVSEGATILFKGWNANRAKNSAGERRAWVEVVDKYGIISSEPMYFGWQGVRFLIHDYHGLSPS